MKFPHICVGLLIALLAVGVARADTIIFDNLGTTTQGFGAVTSSIWTAQKFTSDSGNLLLTSATLTLYSGNGGSGTFFLGLYSDNAGVPGTSLATLTSGPDPFPGPYPQSGNVLFSGLTQPLVANTSYWIVLGENAGATFDIRWGSTNNPTGSGSGFTAISADTPNAGGGWGVNNGAPHQLQLTAVPEPASALLGLLGGALLLARRRSR